MIQLPLCNQDGTIAGRWLKREALDRLETKYAEWLRDRGIPALIIVAQKEELFTSDDVWETLVINFQATPGERRVMGAVFDKCARTGIIVKTDVFEKSRMASCHRRDKALWRSMIYEKPLEETSAKLSTLYKLTAPIINGSDDH